MKNTVRFGTEIYGVRKTTILEWSNILSGNHPGLIEAKRMLPYLQETKSKQPLYEGDILSLKASDVAEHDGFWNSSVGSKMKEREIDEFILHLSSQDHEPLTAISYALKDGKPVTESYMYGVEVKDGTKDEIWREKGIEMLSIRYFIAKGVTCIGNDWENPELVEKFKA